MQKYFKYTHTVIIVILLACGCSNNPFPQQNEDYKIIYMGFADAPKTLDPAIAYTSGMSSYICGSVCETLIEYHYLKRPFELIPSLAETVPQPVVNQDESISYHFKIRQGVFFHADPCFTINGNTNDTREMTAADFEFELKRTADPGILCPVFSTLENIRGMRDFRERLQQHRETDPEFAKLPVNQQYDQIGSISGVRINKSYKLELILDKPYPQILYWMAMPFTAAVPWEAVVYYNGQDGRPPFRDHPVGTGSYYLKTYDKEYQVVLQRNDQWYGFQHPEWKAPAATFPSAEELANIENGQLYAEYAGKSLGFIERFEFRREKESISSFSKFMQGYYDSAGITKDRFDTIVVENKLSEEMRTRNIRLEKNVALHIGYIGFNMSDPDIGDAAGEKGRKLRQAMSLAIDSKEYNRIFMNGRGIPAQSPIPPGIFGYDPNYTNSYRTLNIDRAKEILSDAGFTNGIDPETMAPLQLTFDVIGTSSSTLMAYQFYINAWRNLGLNVRLKATNYNQFQEKVRNGAYQIFTWGWLADYPDPENFLFLLHSDMARTKNNGPNTANFQNDEFDKLFDSMRSRGNDETRYQICRKMVDLLETECPWIPLVHNEDYGLYHAWYKNIKPGGLSSPIFKYWDIKPALRDAYQKENNRPIMWPLYIGLFIFIGLSTPAVITFYRERQ